MRRKLTTKDYAAVRQLYLDGVPIREIPERVDRPYVVVRGMLDRLRRWGKVNSRPRIRNKGTVTAYHRRIKFLHEQGMTASEIAARLGKSTKAAAGMIGRLYRWGYLERRSPEHRFRVHSRASRRVWIQRQLVGEDLKKYTAAAQAARLRYQHGSPVPHNPDPA